MFFSLLACISLGAIENFPPKTVDYQVDLNKRKSFWVPLIGHGWLYRGCEVSLLEALPDYAPSGDPVLAGKEDSLDETHFLFRFRFAGYYRLLFFYQSFTSDVSEGNFPPPDPTPRSVTLYVYDTRRGFKDPSFIFDSEPLFSAVKLPVKSDFLEEKPSTESKRFHSGEMGQAHQNEKIREEKELLKKRHPHQKNQKGEAFEEEALSAEKKASFVWKEHPLFPDATELARLVEESQKEKEPLFTEGASDPFRLGLYYFTQNTNQGMNEAYRWFCYLTKKYPESEWAREARMRSDYISRYYILVR